MNSDFMNAALRKALAPAFGPAPARGPTVDERGTDGSQP